MSRYYKSDGTVAGGITKVVGSALVVATVLCHSTTSNAGLSLQLSDRTSATSASVSMNVLGRAQEPSESRPSTSRSILAIRQMANLTWDETAKLFGVTRRTVHLWANGRHPSSEQEQKLSRTLGVLAPYQGLSPSLLREQLMASAGPGVLFFDLLCAGELEVFRSMFTPARQTAQQVRTSPAIDRERYSSRAPLLLMDALQDRPIGAGKAVTRKGLRLKG